MELAFDIALAIILARSVRGWEMRKRWGALASAAIDRRQAIVFAATHKTGLQKSFDRF
jgi:hypothetical protein